MILQESAEQKEILLIADIDPDLEIFADFAMLNTIIRNLLFNSIKFSERGSQVHIRGVQKEGNISLSVQDYGIGMDANILNGLFKMDERVSRMGTEGEASSGLGLILCKEFVNRHGGQIWAESEKGRGSTFFVQIPNRTPPSI